MLTLESLSAGYGRMRILHEVDLQVGAGELVALVGANGAGKTTTLRSICGQLPPQAGRIVFDGSDTAGRRPDVLVRDGLVHVPEDRALFGTLTVEENLRMGAWTAQAEDTTKRLEQVYELFPILAERRGQVAQTFSGGQQQMLAIGRALMAGPRLLLLDEPSTGLSPKLTWTMLDAVRAIRDTGVSVLLVEQNAKQALAIADRAYVMESGSVVLSGGGGELAGDERVRKAYLGL
ncbi:MULTISPECIES: ABC transporter ATP-binding protein [Prauserella salsuginis group]|uniref:ABC transporter ATP-binding protein n=1 Tax=Prauserella salsuginis TaxID=387889 RepID=A0ABW6G1M4_9PSEU|nr:MULTISPECIES: ABC transporter ATP-binding protein [Prauserella salsuginis group]MCR3722232.1 branched-chain amino acid transport system ATP-binding protein [Prauserella flava]MCR3736230.1 branched-chain amino acid transport system ATP-binding protein [Prauserella salsuginis]